MVYFFAVITTIATLNFLRSPIGRLTLSVREDEIAAESVGVNTTKIKIIAFVFGAVLKYRRYSSVRIYRISRTKRLYVYQLYQCLDYRCIWWFRIHYRGNCCGDRAWNLEHAPSRRGQRSYDYLCFGLSTCYDLQTRWSSWDMGIEPITSL